MHFTAIPFLGLALLMGTAYPLQVDWYIFPPPPPFQHCHGRTLAAVLMKE